MAHGLLPVFVSEGFWNVVTLNCLYIVFGCFHGSVGNGRAEWLRQSLHDLKPKTFIVLPFIEKVCLPYFNEVLNGLKLTFNFIKIKIIKW